VGYGAYGPIRDISNKIPNELSWSFGLQHETSGIWFSTANYIGKKGTHLYFANAGNYSHLGPEIEHYTPAQIADLNTFVDKPVRRSHSVEPSQLLPADNPLLYSQVQKLQLLMAHPQF